MGVDVKLRNTGNYTSDQSVLLYLRVLHGTYAVDNLRLVNFTRIEAIKANEEKSVTLQIMPKWMTVVESFYFNELILPGTYQVMLGENLMFNSKTKTFAASLVQNFTIVGEATNIKDC